MIIIVGLGFTIFGFMMFKLYRGYRFHHSIGIPIIILGLLLVLGGIGFKITESKTPIITDISSQDIHKISIKYVYDPYDSLTWLEDLLITKTEDLEAFYQIVSNGQKCDNDAQTLTWYIELDIELATGRTIYATISRYESGYVFDQTIKFIIPASTGDYYCIDNIQPIFGNNRHYN